MSLPWPAVRSAWAVSMTDIEDDRLDWTDSMQWLLNRISNSQLVVLNYHSVVPGGQKIKICKFFNPGISTNEGHHGIYKHFCAVCHRQGRSLMHPELRGSSHSSNRIQEQKPAAAK